MIPVRVDTPVGRLRLRALEPADADVLAGWTADDEFCRAAEWTVGLDHDDALPPVRDRSIRRHPQCRAEVTESSRPG